MLKVTIWILCVALLNALYYFQIGNMIGTSTNYCYHGSNKLR